LPKQHGLSGYVSYICGVKRVQIYEDLPILTGLF